MRPALVPLAALAALVVFPTVAAQEATEVEVGLLVINFGNYDANKGTYVMDFYLVLKWAPPSGDPGLTAEGWELMNGRASSKERIFDETDPDTGAREVWYRVQANLYSEPRFKDYPYDTQVLAVLLEDTTHPIEQLVYVPDEAASGLDEEVRVAGWRIDDTEIGTQEKEYRFDETYSRLRFAVTVSREPLSTGFKSFLPPLAFIAVSGLSFFLHPSKVGYRLALGTGMVIASVMFHISQTSALPPLGSLILFDKVMLAVYGFLAGSLSVSVLIAIDEDYWKDRDHTRAINVWGAVATSAFAVMTFLVLYAA